METIRNSTITEYDCILDTVLGLRYVIHTILIINHLRCSFYYAHFTDEGTEAQEG
jgi:hypothetical protein